jgi:predicted nucleic acid-binding protein
MQKPRVYVETSIPSFYHELRTTPDVVARRDWTRQWWDEASAQYELLTSPAVINELSAGIPERSALRLSLIRDLPLLPIELAITEIAATYVQQKVMPADPTGDALHLAIASFHKCDFLVTWNCAHIANANKFGRSCLFSLRLVFVIFCMSGSFWGWTLVTTSKSGFGN